MFRRHAQQGDVGIGNTVRHPCFKAIRLLGERLRGRSPDLDRYLSIVFVERIVQMIALADTVIHDTHVADDLRVVGNRLPVGVDDNDGKIGTGKQERSCGVTAKIDTPIDQ